MTWLLSFSLGFASFCGPWSFLTLPAQNVVVDPHTSQIVVTLEKTKTSKQFQQSLALRQGPGQTFDPGSTSLTRAGTYRLLRHFALDNLGFSLYSIKYGGATHFYTATRDHYVTLQGR